MPLTVEIPDSALDALNLPPEELRKELRIDLAVALYARGALPIGKAMEFAGLVRRDFERLPKERQVRRPFDEVELQRELAQPLDETDRNRDQAGLAFAIICQSALVVVRRIAFRVRRVVRGGSEVLFEGHHACRFLVSPLSV